MHALQNKMKNIITGIGLIILFFVLGYSSLNKPIIFQSHLQGWYPSESDALTEMMYDLDAQAHILFPTSTPSQPIRALIVPHAGYQYSGNIAATAYQLLDPTTINRVIVLAPSHRLSFTGIALPPFDQYKTPIGSLSIDKSVVQHLAQQPLFSYNEHVYQTEHSFEMQVPFIIAYLPHVTAIPLIVGSVSSDQINNIAATIAPYINKTTVVIVSSDFTHYGPQFDYTPFTNHIMQRITQLDSGALQAIQNYSLNQFLSYIDHTNPTICGHNALAILLALLETKILGTVVPQLIAYKTSAEVTGQENNSVSYVSMIFVTEQQPISNKKPSFTSYEKKALLALSRAVLRQSFEKKIPDELLVPIKTKEINAPHGAFITLYKKGELRGCIGRVTSDKPLYQTIIDMTRAAAFQDSRFAPVTAQELDDISITISVLTPAKPITTYKDITIGRDGIILQKGSNSALFLPHVATEFKWDLPTTLTQLSQKAGLEPDAWKEPDVMYQTFESIDFNE